MVGYLNFIFRVSFGSVQLPMKSIRIRTAKPVMKQVTLGVSTTRNFNLDLQRPCPYLI